MRVHDLDLAGSILCMNSWRFWAVYGLAVIVLVCLLALTRYEVRWVDRGEQAGHAVRVDRWTGAVAVGVTGKPWYPVGVDGK
jgi:uncharacterized membrane protein